MTGSATLGMRLRAFWPAARAAIPGATRAGGDAARPPRRGPRFKLRSEHLAGAVFVAFMIALRVWDPGQLESARLASFDFYQATAPRPQGDTRVVIADLDEESLAEIGQWPWPRTYVADLVHNLFALGAVAVGFDVIFAEPDRMSPGRIADSLPDLDPVTAASLRRLPSNDQVFAEAIGRGRVVVGQSVIERTTAVVRPPEAADLPRTPIAEIGGDPRPFLFDYADLLRNVPELERAAAGHGFLTLAPERDGIVRRVPAVLRVGDDIYPALSMEMLRVATGQSVVGVRLNRQEKAGIDSVTIGRTPIATDSNGLIWLHFAHHLPARYVSARTILNGNIDPQQVRGKLVLLGTSAIGLKDIKSTPVEDAMPGVEVHAQVIESVLESRLLVRPGWASGAEIGITVVVALAILFLVPLLGPWWTLSIGGAAAGAIMAYSWYSFTQLQMLIDASFPAGANLLLYALMSFANYARVEFERRKVKSAFVRYLSPALVNQLAEHPERLKLGGENRTVTIMFSDLKNFTAISEQFDAVSLTRLINRFFTPITAVILDRNGTVDKFLGDSVMAFWNAPLDDPQHARNACLAALSMRTKIGPLNDDLAREALEAGRKHVTIDAGIGINTGDCCVGNLGAEQRFDYSVIGDAVNLASRLEGQTRMYGVGIIVGESTVAAAGDLAFVELDLLRVVGKSLPARIFTIVGDESVRTSAEFTAFLAAHARLLAAYRASDWPAAAHELSAVRDLGRGYGIDGYYEHMAERIEHFRLSPPAPDWDGSFAARTK